MVAVPVIFFLQALCADLLLMPVNLEARYLRIYISCFKAGKLPSSSIFSMRAEGAPCALVGKPDY